MLFSGMDCHPYTGDVAARHFKFSTLLSVAVQSGTAFPVREVGGKGFRDGIEAVAGPDEPRCC